MRQARGLTLLELLVVLGLVALLSGLFFFSYRKTMAQQTKASFETGVQRLFWEAATAAASRGETLVLERRGNRLIVRSQSNPTRTLRVLAIPDNVSLDLPEDELALFSPPGRVWFRSLFPRDCGSGFGFRLLTGEGGERCYRVSYIGEVLEVLP